MAEGKTDSNGAHSTQQFSRSCQPSSLDSSGQDTHRFAQVADPSNWNYGDKCWFHRTAPKNASLQQGPIGIQQLPFSALADAAPGTNITLVVEAWSDRNDLGDGSKAELLATSAPLTFTYDDKGFSSKASFVNFAAVQTAIGDVTISAQPADTGFYQYVTPR